MQDSEHLAIPPPTAIDSLRALLPKTMLRDRHRIASRLRAAEAGERSGRNVSDAIRQIADEMHRSMTIRTTRAQAALRPSFPIDLPVVERKNDIAQAIQQHQVIVVCGETGSGKTTQLPKICLDIGRGIDGMIGHTQPRRIAARSVATRIAEELHTRIGQGVGFKIRFTDETSENTFIKVMTDGILLAEFQSDRFLERYDTIIIDEAHERSLNIDFLLGSLHGLLPRRPDLKLIITSATIDPDRFSKHFHDAPILMVSGRTYPVETRYRPMTRDDPDIEDQELIPAILESIDALWLDAGPGDTLIFLTGERDIRETAEALRKHHPPNVDILPLYARLSGEEQMRVFTPHVRPRIVLATNVAETSLTVPGIKYVIDPGLARISRYSPRTKVQRLPIEAVSQASADQRKGRCGRVAAGICVRLYSETDFNARPAYTDPEILRTNLASVILQMKANRLGNVEEFPFLDPPDHRQIRDGYATLHELGAIDEENNLTELGRTIARLPIDPRLARMILAAADEAQVLRDRTLVDDVLIIVAALSVQDPRDRPMDKAEQADAAHAPFRDGSSDFLSFLKLWTWFGENSRHLSQQKLRKLCQQNFLSYVRLREWVDIHSQIKEVAGELRLLSHSQ